MLKLKQFKVIKKVKIKMKLILSKLLKLKKRDEEWVKEPEKKFRSFTLAEWIEKHEIGEVIHYRNKSEGIDFRHMYMGYAFGKGKDITKINVGTVTLGVASYSFDYLFEDYEIEINGEWKPFGVEE